MTARLPARPFLADLRRSASALRLLAGPDAFERVRDRGLRLEDFDVLVAPAGGTKFLMLGGLDRVLFGGLKKERHEPLHAVGASIGAFRLACLACDEPESALDRLAAAYIALAFTPARADARRLALGLVQKMLGDERREDIADSTQVRLHVLTTRCRGLMSLDRWPPLLTGLGLAAAGNFVSRRSLGAQLTRVAFHSRGEPGPLGALRDLPTEHATLAAHNLEAALMASAAVPALVPGVRIPGGPEGVHRDGGLLDYHPVLSLHPSEKLVLYPHFYEHLTPGWFDRGLSRRRARGQAVRRMVLLAPSESFLASLPGGVRPTRRDAFRYSKAECARRWRAVWERGTELGHALADMLASPRRAALAVEAL